MSKITVITCGLEFANGEVHVMVLPEGMDICFEKALLLSKFPPNHCTLGLKDWLLSRGARLAEPDEVQIIDGW
jgi:hypothetical protein